MLGWNSNYNWTKEETLNVVRKAIVNGETSVGLDTEHNDYQNELDMKRWIEEMGYEADIQNERIQVKLTK